jgi:hypothetical protein
VIRSRENVTTAAPFAATLSPLLTYSVPKAMMPTARTASPSMSNGSIEVPLPSGPETGGRDPTLSLVGEVIVAVPSEGPAGTVEASGAVSLVPSGLRGRPVLPPVGVGRMCEVLFSSDPVLSNSSTNAMKSESFPKSDPTDVPL